MPARHQPHRQSRKADEYLRMLESLAHCIVRCVAQVNDNAEAVHLLDELVPQRAETAPLRLERLEIPTRVSECVVAHVREGDVAYAKLVVLAQDAKRVAELVCTVEV